MCADQNFYDIFLKFFDPTADHFLQKNTGSIFEIRSIRYFERKITKYNYQYTDNYT